MLERERREGGKEKKKGKEGKKTGIYMYFTHLCEHGEKGRKIYSIGFLRGVQRKEGRL